MKDETRHAAFVGRWLARAAEGPPEEDRLLRFEKALAALWQRGHVTLGEVMLGAVLERVLHHATERYPFLAPLEVKPDGVHFEGLRGSLDPAEARVTEAFRFVLVELFTVLGTLTDDVIIPALQAALSRVPPLRDAHDTRGPQAPSPSLARAGKGPT